MSNRERLLQLAASLPEDVAGEVLDFVEHVRARRVQVRVEPEGAPNAEDRAWLDADLSRLDEEGPYDWGDADPLEGRPVYWDAERGAFMAGGRP